MLITCYDFSMCCDLMGNYSNDIRKGIYLVQEVVVNCKIEQRDDIIHILKLNDYIPVEFQNKDEVILLIDLYDCQINLLVKIIYEYSKEVTVDICHKISFFE